MSGYAGIDPKEDGAVPFTKANAREMCLRGLAVRRHLREQRKVWETTAIDITPEMAEFYAMFGFTGERKRFIDNKYKLIFPALKKMYDKGNIEAILKFFASQGLEWASDSSIELAAFNATIKPDANNEVKDEDRDVIVHVNEVKTDGEADRH
jgi:hypothetical protein